MTTSTPNVSLALPQPTETALALHRFIEAMACSMGEKRLAKFRNRTLARIERLEQRAGADLGPNVVHLRDPRGETVRAFRAESLAHAHALRLLLSIATNEPLDVTGKVPGPEAFQ